MKSLLSTTAGFNMEGLFVGRQESRGPTLIESNLETYEIANSG